MNLKFLKCWPIFPLGAVVVSIGCNQSDSREYHTVKSISASQSVVAKPVSGDSNSDSPTENGAATVEGPAQKAQEKPSESSQVNSIQPALSELTAAVPTEIPEKIAKPRPFEILIKDKSFRQDSKTRALRVSYDDLDLAKVMGMEKVVENAVDLMPNWLRDLSGKKIRIRGFMLPSFDAEGIERFVLARDTGACCFGPNPTVFYLIDVRMKQGTSTNYIPPSRAFDVVGKFRIEMVAQEGKVFGLYSLDDAEVIDR